MADSDVVLGENAHGKGRVRMLKVLRARDGTQTVLSYTCQILVEGEDMSAAFLHGDNSIVVPTDTIRNTVYVLAKENEFSSPEAFALILTRHFLATYPTQVCRVHATVVAEDWQRVQVPDSHGNKNVPHKHVFRRIGPTKRVAWAVQDSYVWGKRAPRTISSLLSAP